MESPIPDRGPIREAFKALIDSGSKFSGLFAFSFSIAADNPIIKGAVS